MRKSKPQEDRRRMGRLGRTKKGPVRECELIDSSSVRWTTKQNKIAANLGVGRQTKKKPKKKSTGGSWNSFRSWRVSMGRPKVSTVVPKFFFFMIIFLWFFFERATTSASRIWRRSRRSKSRRGSVGTRANQRKTKKSTVIEANNSVATADTASRAVSIRCRSVPLFEFLIICLVGTLVGFPLTWLPYRFSLRETERERERERAFRDSRLAESAEGEFRPLSGRLRWKVLRAAAGRTAAADVGAASPASIRCGNFGASLSLPFCNPLPASLIESTSTSFGGWEKKKRSLSLFSFSFFFVIPLKLRCVARGPFQKSRHLIGPRGFGRVGSSSRWVRLVFFCFFLFFFLQTKKRGRQSIRRVGATPWTSPTWSPATNQVESEIKSVIDRAPAPFITRRRRDAETPTRLSFLALRPLSFYRGTQEEKKNKKEWKT